MQATESRRSGLTCKHCKILLRSIANYGTVGCTKDLMRRGKCLIIVDCITENGPIPGALWTFSTESKTKREEKHYLQFIETAVAEQRDRENENLNQKQEDQMQKSKASTSDKRNINYNSIDQHLTKKTKVDNALKNNGEDENTEREEEMIMHDFYYYDKINAESSEKYFENICKLLSQIVLLLLITPAITREMWKTFLCQNGEKHSFNHG